MPCRGGRSSWCPAGSADASRAGRRSPDVFEVEAGETLDLDGVRVQAVEARHWISPGAPRAKPVGYVVDAGRRVYFAGDTGRFPEMPERWGASTLRCCRFGAGVHISGRGTWVHARPPSSRGISARPPLSHPLGHAVPAAAPPALAARAGRARAALPGAPRGGSTRGLMCGCSSGRDDAAVRIRRRCCGRRCGRRLAAAATVRSRADRPSTRRRTAGTPRISRGGGPRAL